MIRTYKNLKRLKTIEARFEYLKLEKGVGESTFGYDRWMNQKFYKSPEWKEIRHLVIVRDLGCDLGIPGFEITDRILIHHMNPIVKEDIIHGSTAILDPEYLITTSFLTHQAIHYGRKLILPNQITDRTPGDTLLWKRRRGEIK